MKNNQKILSETRGTWYAIISGMLYGLLGYFGVTLINSGFSPFNVAFWRFFVASLFLLLVVMVRGSNRVGSLRQCILAMVNGGIFYGAPGILFFISSGYIGTGQAMVIFFIFPVFVMLLNRIFLKEPIKTPYIFSFALILLGLILLVDIGEMHLDFLGISMSLMAALCYAIYIFVSKWKLTSVPALTSSLLVALGCMINCGVIALIDGSLSFPSELMQWANISGLGIICSALPILFLFEALEHISADKASLLSVLEPVCVVIVGVLILGELLSLASIFGIVLILIGSMTVTITWKMPAISRWKGVS